MGKKGKGKAKTTSQPVQERNSQPAKEASESISPLKQKSSSGKQREITWSQVGQHSFPDDAWVVIDGSVYDLNRYAAQYPDSTKKLLHRAGKEATRTFNRSKQSIEWLKKSLLGQLHQGSMIQSWQRESETGRGDAIVALFLTVFLVAFMGYMIQ